ncbi:MAG TPA: hypothetical protein VE961_02505 [Pyrinomonadaceae bacterium]|nr:hypothetical protein [Pyrinomonadaceae bacterium]
MIGETRPQFSDETIRQFLLGELPAEQQTEFELSLVVEDDLEERVRLAELELSDDYAAGRLSPAEHSLFRDRFMLTAARSYQVQVSQALQHTLSAAAPARDPFAQRVINALDFRRHVWQYAFATLTLVLLVLATAILIKKEKTRIVESRNPPRVAPRPSSTSTPRLTNHSINPPAPSHSEPAPALPLHEGLASTVVLDAGTPRESAPVVSSGGESITVELKLDQPLAELYDVNVMTLSGESVFSANALKRTEPETLVFDVPTSVLSPGDFQITLIRLDGDSKQSAGGYYFRVR